MFCDQISLSKRIGVGALSSTIDLVLTNVVSCRIETEEIIGKEGELSPFGRSLTMCRSQECLAKELSIEIPNETLGK